MFHPAPHLVAYVIFQSREREKERDVDRGIDVRFTDDINKTETKGGILHREIPARSIIVALAENHMSRSSTWMPRASIYDRHERYYALTQMLASVDTRVH